MKRHYLIIISCLMALSLSGTLFAQTPAGLTGQTKNYISTGMPILLIAPDATSAGMGDVGVASTPDIYSAHWNNAKFAFIDGNFGIGTTYTPWLRNLKVSDMNLLYLGAFKRINNRSTVAFSLTYFSLGEIQGTDAQGQSRGTMNPNEFAADVTYAMKLNENLSLGASGRYIHSDLTNGQTISDGSGYVTTQPPSTTTKTLPSVPSSATSVPNSPTPKTTQRKNSCPPTCVSAAVTPTTSTPPTRFPSSSTPTSSWYPRPLSPLAKRPTATTTRT